MILKNAKFRHCVAQTRQPTTPSLRANKMSVAKQGEAEVSLVIHKESIDSAKSSLRGSNATEAIHKKIDCHESLCDSHNDDSFTFPK